MPPAAATPSPARILIVRLGSMGDIVHAMPAVHALRAAHPAARMDWLVEAKWQALVASVSGLSNVIAFDRASLKQILATIRSLRGNAYDFVIDLQGLYKSALVSFFSRARHRVGLAAQAAREPGAAAFYSERVLPTRAHVIEQNLELAAKAGAQTEGVAFPALCVPDSANAYISRVLEENTVDSFYVLSPGGGWRSKCWPAEQYGQLHRILAEKYGLRALVSFGPGEENLAESVRAAAGEPAPILVPMNLHQLMAALRRAKFVVAADTGPLHLAAGLGTPVVGLFGPTDPGRNGPRGSRSIVIRNAGHETTYKRGDDFSPAMRSIRVEQVLEACGQLLESPR